MQQSVRRPYHMALLVDKFFHIDVYVVRMGMYFVTLSVFPFTFVCWRKESPFIVEALMIYCTI